MSKDYIPKIVQIAPCWDQSSAHAKRPIVFGLSDAGELCFWNWLDSKWQLAQEIDT